MSETTVGDGHSFLLLLLCIIDLLDSLVSYLRKYVRRFNEKLSPRWLQQRLNGEYFHVKIAAQSNDEEDCYFESLDTYICHICNLDVPKIYNKQHNESKPHKICKKICEKVLERVAKQININNIDNDCDDTKNLYYCTPCSRAVNLKNKDQHESSDYHKKSEENMNIINYFYKQIIEDGTRIPSEHSHDESDSDSDESETQDAQHDTVNNNLEIPHIRNDLQKEIAKDEEVVNVTSISDKNKEAFKKSQDLQTVSQLKTTELCNGSTSEQHQSFNSYLKEMISKYKLDVSTPVTDGEYIIIVSPNGDKVKVPREHFHSYKHIYKRVYCQVCKMWISQDTRPHEITEIHVRNIFKSVNENYARMMDTVDCHCLICNEVILTESDHQNMSDVHKNLLVDAKIQENSENIDRKTLCKLCNINIETQDLKSHNNSMEHSSKKEVNAGMLEINNVVKIYCSEYFCNSCKMYLDSNTLNNHINNKIHVDKISVPNVVTKAEYCEICNVEVSQGGMKAHSFTECFKDVIIKAVCDVIKDGFNKPSLTDNAHNKCLTSQNKTMISNNAQNESLTSQTKAALADTPQNKSLTFENKPSRTDTVQNESLTSHNKPLCDTAQNKRLTSQNKPSITDSAQNKISTSQNKTMQTIIAQKENLTTQNETAQANTAQDKSKTTTSSANNNTSNYREIDIFDAKLVVYTDNTKSHVKCAVCNIQVLNFENNIRDHLETKSHKQVFESYSKLLDWNDDTKTAVKCRICDLWMPNLQGNLYVHMNGELHKKKVEELLDFHEIKKDGDVYQCSICGTFDGTNYSNLRIYDYFNHIITDDHTAAVLRINNFGSKVFQIYVYENTSNNGSKATIYKYLHKNLLRINKIGELDMSRFYCGICSIELPRMSEIHHVFGYEHINKMRIKSNTQVKK